MSDMKMPISMGKYADKDLRKAYVFMARNAEGAERYKDMCKFMKGLVLTGADLTLEERNLFSIGYKNVVGSLRAAWRTVNTEEVKFNDLMKAYRETLEDELQDTCKDALALLEGNLIHAGKTPEAKVFYLKMVCMLQ